MYSSCDTPKGGFPHSEISGSMLICQLPEAYRRLSRLSSPIIAKASTTCSYSLDPITLNSLARSHRHFKECLSGLSPDALCRNMNNPSTPDISIQYKRTIRHYLNFKRSLNIRFDAIKKLSPGARSALNLYECAVSPGNSDSTL